MMGSAVGKDRRLVDGNRERELRSRLSEGGQGGAEAVILFLSDPGGNGRREGGGRLEIVPCQDWEHAGQQGGRRTGWGGGGLRGTIIVIYIHIHACSRRVADG